MKSLPFLFLFGFAVILSSTAQVRINTADTVEVVQDFKNLYRYQNFFLGGQPTYESLLWLKSHGVKKVINLRSEKENSDFSGTAFNEQMLAQASGIEYYQVPVEGTRDYTPEKLAALTGLLNLKDSILIHCASGVRATDFFMAYLIRNRGYSVDDAVEVGRKLKFSLPLEKLLDAKMKVEFLKK
jgi:protein tyrosine phosphatase (PTP) superfamily phosphohydrolase (DUF442 family)